MRATYESFLHESLGVPYPPMIGLAFRESFLHEMFTSNWSVKVFSLESLPPYGSLIPWHFIPYDLKAAVMFP